MKISYGNVAQHEKHLKGIKPRTTGPKKRQKSRKSATMHGNAVTESFRI